MYVQQLPGVACATSGPAKEYPSANKTKERKCWWGKEYLYSKRDSHYILDGAFDAVAIGGGIASVYFSAVKVAIGLLVGYQLGFGDTAKRRAHEAIDSGKCLKLVMMAHIVPSPGTYRCT
jgi:hypothetical protein